MDTTTEEIKIEKKPGLPEAAPPDVSLEGVRRMFVSQLLRDAAEDTGNSAEIALLLKVAGGVADGTTPLPCSNADDGPPAMLQALGLWGESSLLLYPDDANGSPENAELLIALLGNRLTPVVGLNSVTLKAIATETLILDMGNWHGDILGSFCGTTHCRAGFATAVHPIGKELDKLFGADLAGAAIYLKSTGEIPNFFCGNEEAMKDIERCAAMEQLAAAGVQAAALIAIP